MLRKVLKYDIKNLFMPLAILFGATLIIPLFVYFMTINANIYSQMILRSFVGYLLPVVTVLLTFICLATSVENDFIGKRSYLVNSIPVKIKTLLLSKGIIFYVSSVLSIVFAVLCYTIVYMDFAVFEEAFNYIKRNLGELSDFEGYLYVVLMILRTILAPVGIYAYVCAATAFAHLFGTKKTLGSFLFTVIFITFCGIFVGISSEMMYRFNINSEVFFYIDCVLSVALTVGFFIFTNHVFTKKINII
jgi:hypothetical protein